MIYKLSLVKMFSLIIENVRLVEMLGSASSGTDIILLHRQLSHTLSSILLYRHQVSRRCSLGRSHSGYWFACLVRSLQSLEGLLSKSGLIGRAVIIVPCDFLLVFSKLTKFDSCFWFYTLLSLAYGKVTFILEFLTPFSALCVWVLSLCCSFNNGPLVVINNTLLWRV